MSKVMYLLPVVTNGQQLEPANYDWQDVTTRALTAQQLKDLADYQAAMREVEFRSWYPTFNASPKEVAMAASQHRRELSGEVRAAIEAANRPDSIPADMTAMRVTGWQEPTTRFIPGKAAKNAPLKELLSDKAGMTVKVPARPIGILLGDCSADAWRPAMPINGKIPPHVLPIPSDWNFRSSHYQPLPLPAYNVPQRALTASEQEVKAWLAQGREARPMRKTSKLARMMARHWDKGDNRNYQPIDRRNEELRAGVA